MARWLLVVVFALHAGLAGADPAVGLWQTPPDRKDLTSHIAVRLCGAKLCGTIIAAFDPTGKQVQTPNIGKELFWDMTPHGDGGYSNGTAWVPLLNVQVRASMTLSGNRLTVRGCKGPICDTQVWTRLQ
ncbi:MAG: DUF2147 domain-containing protein [Deltaproteobacteria bacterium]